MLGNKYQITQHNKFEPTADREIHVGHQGGGGHPTYQARAASFRVRVLKACIQRPPAVVGVQEADEGQAHDHGHRQQAGKDCELRVVALVMQEMVGLPRLGRQPAEQKGA